MNNLRFSEFLILPFYSLEYNPSGPSFAEVDTLAKNKPMVTIEALFGDGLSPLRLASRTMLPITVS